MVGKLLSHTLLTDLSDNSQNVINLLRYSKNTLVLLSLSIFYKYFLRILIFNLNIYIKD